MLSTELAAWLDHRRASATKARRAGTLDELAERRRRMNPRLPLDWLRYLVTVGGRQDEDGWRWKIDPGLRMGGFGPWRPEWSLIRLPGIRVPFLGVLAGQPEVMGWGTQLEDIAPWLPDGAEIESFDDAGHFVHIEQPEPVAALVLDFLDRHS
jgi:pimeloyl-ACP methyl ester carboxylesterase